MRTSSMAAAFLASSLAFFAGVCGIARAAEPMAAPAGAESSTSGAPPAPAPAAGGEAQTLAAKASARERPLLSGWFVAPTFATTSFNGKISASPGMRGGIYLDRQFAIGLTASGILNGDTILKDNEVRNVGGYGGVLLQYVLRSNEVVHASVESTVGAGRWCTEIRDGEDDDAGRGDGKEGCIGKNFFVFEPAVNVEVNLARHVRLTAGGGYRFAVAGNGSGPSSRDMDGFVGRAGLLFGSF